MKMRPIEMYLLRENNTWTPVIVDIPADTPPDRIIIEEAGRDAMKERFGECVTMLYNSMDDECPEIPERSEIVVKLTFDMGQTTVGAEEKQQAAAIEQINLALQRVCGDGLGARIEKADLSWVTDMLPHLVKHIQNSS